MLVENAAYPFGDWESEHIVAVGIGPIGHRHPRAMTGHQPPNDNQAEGRNRREDGEAVQPGTESGSSIGSSLRSSPAAHRRNRCG